MRPQILHNFIVISIDAEKAARSIREVWPEWQPQLSFGFQGRLVMVVGVSELMFEGKPTGIKQNFLVAAGTDAHAREALEMLRCTQGNRFVQEDGLPISELHFNQMVDKAFRKAMPVSYMFGRESLFVVDVPRTEALNSDVRARLEAYQARNLAPEFSDDAANWQWSIPLSLEDGESFYILLDVYQSARLNLNLRSSHRGDNVGMRYLVDCYNMFDSSKAFASAA